MDLVITEKPSVAETIAGAVGAMERKKDCFAGNGHMVSWCVGHLVELAQPEDYDVSYKKWDYDMLPIFPERWQYKIKDSAKAQFFALKKLMGRTDVGRVINACDAGREGELIFRLAYEMAGCTKPVERLWLSSMEESAIRAGFAALKPGSAYDSLYQSALCRMQADWLVGINGTRLFTVLYKSRVLKVGRVQTPTLAMLVEREESIRGFKKEPFYTVRVRAGGIHAASEKFSTKEEAESAEKAVVSENLCIMDIKQEEKRTPPPRLYDLTTLQRDANCIFGFTAKQTLEYAQSLYEKKLCTYPRTDSRFLTDDMGHAAEEAVRVVRHVIFPEAGTVKEPESGWDIARLLDSRNVSEHLALIPTASVESTDICTLPGGEQKILSLVGCRLLCAAGAAHVYQDVRVEMKAGAVVFGAKGKITADMGWKAYEKSLLQKYRISTDGDGTEDAFPKEQDGDSILLRQLRTGMVFTEYETEIIEGMTQPPKPYTEGTLLAAMERAGSGDMDADVERKGLGTPATRADVIEKLVRDRLVRRENKNLRPTDDGIRLVTVLPDTLKSAQLTVVWENALLEIAKGQRDSREFLDGIRKMVSGMVAAYHGISKEAHFSGEKEALGQCPHCGKDVLDGKYGVYCAGKCGMTFGYAFGKKLEKEQIRELLAGKRILVDGLKSKKGNTYRAYLIPDGTEAYTWEKDGETRGGYRFRFKVDFPERKGGKNPKP